MTEKKNLRKQLREMAVGEVIVVKREDYLPSTVKSTIYALQIDFGRQREWAVRNDIPEGCEVRRVS